MDDELIELAADAYVYGYPMLYDLHEVLRCRDEGMGSLPARPFNRFSHATQLGGPDDKFVSINNDTIYSIAMLDLSGGPLLLRVPDTGGTYGVLQFVDAWTNNFAYVGRRATGTAAQNYLITGPGWAGDVPAGAARIASPTMVASIIGRLACDGPGDVPRIRALQERLTLEPLPGAAELAGIPEPEAILAAVVTGEGGVPGDMRFFELMRMWMAAFPPSAADQAYQARFAPLGLLDTRESPYAAASPEMIMALTAGITEGRDHVEAASKAGLVKPVNGWSTGLHIFDYNLDHFEIGTIDAPEWKIRDRRASYLVRAIAARIGLWGNHAYEAVYSMTFQDSAGDQLTGERSYTLRFEEQPPVDAFWSVTMYDVPDYWLADNPIDRYSIGDRTPGLVTGTDGSLTIVMSHDRPADADVPNWLPAPPGAFRPVLRMYQPKPQVFDGTYQIPPIHRRG